MWNINNQFASKCAHGYDLKWEMFLSHPDVTIPGSVFCDKNNVYILYVSISNHKHLDQR